MCRAIYHLMLIALIFTVGVGFGQVSQNADDGQIAASVQTFSQVYQIVKENYADPVKDDKAIYQGAIPGMLKVLDPHSNFFAPEDYVLLQREEKGEKYGIGLSLTSEGTRVIVATTLPNAPAHRAGIRVGDIIIAVSGRSTTGLDTGAVARIIEGERKSNVCLTVKREDSPASLSFVIPRKKIRAASAYAFLIAPGIGYLEISGFDETTAREVRHALNQLGRLNGLILDLRQNPGGLLSVATDVADMFLPKDALIGALVERSAPQEVYRARHGEKGRQYPIVILVDEGTASAAELLAGALQDQDRALIAGQNTFGKSVAQTVFPLAENTALALTTGKLYLPSGRLIQHPWSGITEIDYYYSRPINTRYRQLTHTRTGRPVYGGAGIAPDVALPVYSRNRFEDRLLHDNAVVVFSTEYVARHKINRHSEVTADVLQDFRQYLSQQRIPFTSENLRKSGDWLRLEIRANIVAAAFGPEEALRVRATDDVEVRSAIRLLPAARRLASGE